jgi:hypothetical protein
MVADSLRRSFRFFHGRTGQVGWEAAVAIKYARAELHARANGWRCEWVDDPDGMPADGLCSCGCGHEIEACEGCILYDEDGKTLGSLWAIWDADGNYKRIVEAELALEAM